MPYSVCQSAHYLLFDSTMKLMSVGIRSQFSALFGCAVVFAAITAHASLFGALALGVAAFSFIYLELSILHP